MRLGISILTVLLFAFCATVLAQEDDVQTEDKVAVEQIFLAKDNGEGKAGDIADSFLTSDIPIYCIVQLNSTKQSIVKMNLVAVSVAGVKAETRVISVSYTTNGKQNRVNFTGRPDGAWTAGTYRIDIFIGDKLAGSQKFEIKRSALDAPAETAPAIGPAKPPKSKAKLRTARSIRKN